MQEEKLNECFKGPGRYCVYYCPGMCTTPPDCNNNSTEAQMTWNRTLGRGCIRETKKNDLDGAEKEYIYWLIIRKDKKRHIAEDIISKLGFNDISDTDSEAILAKWDHLTRARKE